MPPERAFRVLREHSDRIHVRQIASIALTCVGLGLGLSGAATRFMHIHARPQHSHEQAHPQPRDEPAQAALIAWPLLGAQREPRSDSARTTADEPARAPLRLVRERVTYLRCQRGASGAACPHARSLEKQVWRALRNLTGCYRAAAPGNAELQLSLRRGRAAEIAFLPPPLGPGLNLRAVRGCVERPLHALSDRLADEPMHVSFRFGLR